MDANQANCAQAALRGGLLSLYVTETAIERTMLCIKLSVTCLRTFKYGKIIRNYSDDFKIKYTDIRHSDGR